MSGTAVQRDAHVAESTCHCLNKHDECIIEAEMAMRGRFDAAGTQVFAFLQKITTMNSYPPCLYIAVVMRDLNDSDVCARCISFEQHVSGCSLSKIRDDASTCKKELHRPAAKLQNTAECVRSGFQPKCV